MGGEVSVGLLVLVIGSILIGPIVLGTAVAVVGFGGGWFVGRGGRRPDRVGGTDAGGDPPTDTAALLADRLAERRVADLLRRLQEAQEEVSWLRAQLVAVVDAKDAEIGRLESAAVSALDGSVARLQQRIGELEAGAAAAAAQADRAQRERDDERRAADRLRAALAGRGAAG